MTSNKPPIISSLTDEGGAVLKLILMFVGKLPEIYDELIDLYKEQDWETLSLKIHSIKGTGGNFGFNDITVLAEKIENKIDSEEYEAIEEMLESLEELKQQIEAGVNCYKT